MPNLKDVVEVVVSNAKNLVKNPKEQATRALQIAKDSMTDEGLVGKAKADLSERGTKVDEQLDKYKRGGSVASKVHSIKQTRGRGRW